MLEQKRWNQKSFAPCLREPEAYKRNLLAHISCDGNEWSWDVNWPVSQCILPPFPGIPESPSIYIVKQMNVY